MSFHKNVFQKLYGFVVILSVFVMTVIQMFGKLNFVYPLLKTSVCALDGGVALLIVFLEIVDAVNRNFINVKTISRFYNHLNKIDKFLDLPPVRNYFLRGVLSYKFFVIIVHCVTFAMFFNDVTSNNDFYGWQGHKYNCISFILIYKMTWFVIRLYVTVNEIRRRFELLNRKFELIIRTTNSETPTINYLKCHDMLCGLITKVNKTYGFQIMIMDKLIALRVVETSYLCVLFAIEERTKLSVLSFVNNCLWSICFIICGALISFSCGKANKQAQFMIVLCQNLYNKVGGHPLKEEILMQFAKQVVLAKPEFNCLGFFPVNYGSFLKILSSIFNYIIIVLQFDI
ncbi:uncharacterized protein LOC123005192 [Tribolium madens]|uniref:uncharacterized protein LOC123005192 n=1 Tax=Tribolium madens TaxID=41895 RepID=UPI001CF72439|nr:uncharacterized protein LOC123005192 [Tribolium madens]